MTPAVAQYLMGRGIGRDTSDRFQLGYVNDPTTGHERYAGRLSIPSIGPTGRIYNLRFRALKPEQEPKYLGIPGMPTRLFNVRAILEASDTLCVAEGEIDCISLEACGFHAIGVPGANAWKRHHARMLHGFREVLIFGDGDSAGFKFATTVAESLRNGRVIPIPEGQDVNHILANDGEEAVIALTEG